MNTIERATTGLVAECGGRAQRRIRIGSFQVGFPEPDGMTTAVRGLSRALASRGHEVTIYGCGAGDADAESRPGLRALLFPLRTRNPFFVPRALLRRLEANEDGLELLILHSMFHPANVAVERAARRAGIPYIVCPHDPYHPNLLRKNRIRKLVYGFLFEKPALRRAAAVQLLSASHETHLRAFGIRTPVLTVPNGFYESEVACGPINGPLSGNPALLLLGRVDKAHKGHDLLIRALGLMLGRATLPPGLRVHVAGPMSADTNRLVRLANSLGVGAHFQFHGQVPDTDRWTLLRNCDAVVLCSRYDGFGLVALEGMVCGRPVFVSSQAGIAEWVRQADCGIEFDPEPSSVAIALEEVLKRRPEWDSMGSRGQHFARRHMSWDRMAEIAERQYEELLGRLEADGANFSEPAVGWRAR